MSEEPVILITDPEKQLIEKNNFEIEINNYDNSHLYYKGFDLGTFKEIANLRQENQQLKIQISAREEECKKLGKIVRDVGMWNTLYNEEFNKNKKLENNWNKLKEYISKNIIYDDVGMKILDPTTLEDKMQELERGVSDVED